MMYSQNMEKRIKDFVKNGNWVFVIFFFLTLLLYSQCDFRVGSDDSINIENINKMGVIQWLYWRSVNWQPKIFSDLFFALIKGNLKLWSILSSVITAVTVVLISSLALLKNKKEGITIYVNILICCLYFSIYPFTLNSATFWYTGSFAYAWQFLILIISLYPYILEIYDLQVQYKLGRVGIIIASIMCSYTEPTLAILLCFGVVVLLAKKLQKKHISKYLIYNLLFVGLNGLVFIYYSIKAGRINKEIHWYPDFPMLTSVDKVFQGINWTNYYYINSINLIMWVFMIVLFINVYLNKNINKYVMSLFSLPLIYMTLNVLPLNTIIDNFNKNNMRAEGYWGHISSYFWGEKQHNLLFNTMYANPSNIEYSYKALLPSFLGMIFILSIIVLLFLASNDFRDFIVDGLLYLAAIMSGYIMILSPTIFASGVRVFFIGTMLIIIIIMKYFVDLLNKDINLNIIKIGLAIMMLFTIPLYLQLFFIITKMGEIL